MNEPKRYLTIHFNDDTKMVIDFPQQHTDPQIIATRLKEVMHAKQVMLEVDGTLIAIPLSSVKYIQAYPAPEKLPDGVIRGARFVAVD